MARFNQKRKRSSGPMRRNMKRRRVMRNRRSSAFSSTKGTPSSFGFASKRLTKSKIRNYKRSLYMVSNAMQKYRLAGAATVSVTTPANNVQFTVIGWQMFRNLCLGTSLVTPGNYVSDQGTTGVTTMANSVIFRGGISSLVIASEETETIQYIVQVIRTMDTHVIPSTTAGAIAKNEMIIFGDASNNNKVLKTWHGFLAPSSATEFKWKLPIKKVDLERHESGVGTYWHIGVGNTVTGTAVSVHVTGFETCYACPDVIS